MKRSSAAYPFELGLSSYALTWSIGMPGHFPPQPMTAMELLEESHRLQCDRLQIADNLPVHLLPPNQWQQLIQRAETLNIQVELGMRGLHPARLEQYVALAKMCQSPFLRVVIDEGDFEPTLPQIIQIIQQALSELKSAGIPLAIENHDRFRAKELVEIIERTDPQVVGICLDTANSLGANEGIYEVARLLAPYVINLHVKDYIIRRLDHQMGFRVTGTPAGQGHAPISWLLELLAGYDNCHSITLEVWSEPLSNWEATLAQERNWVDQSIGYLTPLLESFKNPHYIRSNS